MLTTLLDNKVRGGRWHALIDKVYAELNLIAAALKVTGKEKAAGVDGQSCEAFEEHLLVETRQLAEQIKAQTYRPQAVRRVHIPKPGRPNETRPFCIPTVRDRVVQRAIVNVIEPILDHQMSDHGFEIVRYADDFVVLCRTQAEAEGALQKITQWVEQAGLTLHPTKTKIVDS
mgnify:CR=1 FL=1|jgi:RNA-directed DNA polymerase